MTMNFCLAPDGYNEVVHLSTPEVVVVVFIFQYGNIHLHTSDSIFINKYIFEKKKLFERVKSHTKTNHKIIEPY